MIFWDTSALVAVLIAEQETAMRRAQMEADPQMAVWWGAVLECESAFQRRLREKSITPQQVQQAHARLDLMAESWEEIPPSPELRRLALRLVRTHPLRAADALQLAAALTLLTGGLHDLRFACADLRLKTAAQIEGLTVT